MLPPNVIELKQPHPVECWYCDATDEITALMRVAEKFNGLQVAKAKDEPAWLLDD